MVGVDGRKILERLPYIGLDIESVNGDTVRVEYSPNRPDFGTDFGIARALRGILGKETGLPKFEARDSGVRVSVDPRLSKVRPYIACAIAKGLRLNEEDVRQIISLQEDLHNGLGRKRKAAAIGLHDLRAIRPPISYRGVTSEFSFVPLDSKSESTISKILSDTTEGRAYGGALGDSGVYPVITDSRGTLLSFPPIINGDATRVTSKTKDMFVDVTSMNRKTGEDVLAILVTTLAEAGGSLESVTVDYRSGKRITPDLAPAELPIDLPLIRRVLGLELSKAEVASCLARSRMSARGNRALGARYRIDLLHPVDVAEEVALGYGVDKITGLYPPSKQAGEFNRFERFLDSTSTVMAGEGMIELMTFELTDMKTLYTNFGRRTEMSISVEDPKSSEHSLLRDGLVPGLMAALSGNVKSDYPQRIFEIGRVYTRTESGVEESWHLGSLVAHSQASYSEAKATLESALGALIGKEALTKSVECWAFALGRSASIVLDDAQLGWVGEVSPQVLEAFGLRVPVAGFEVDLTALGKIAKIGLRLLPSRRLSF